MRSGDLVSFGKQQYVLDGADLKEFVDTGRISLTATELSVHAGEKKIVDGVSFDLDECTLLAVVGPSGAGKSSLLGAFAITNVTTYLVLRSWCTHVEREGLGSSTCDENTDRAHTAATLRSLGDLNPTTLALMHGPSFSGDGKRAFYDLAAAYEQLAVPA